MKNAERRTVNILEMKCVRNMVGVTRIDRVRNEEVCRRVGIEIELAGKSGSESGEMVWTHEENG